MGVLDLSKINEDVVSVFNQIENNQWQERKIDFNSLKEHPIITREELRATPMLEGFYRARTSGSTGIPLAVEKTYQDHIWFSATNILDFKWRGWDVTKDVAIIKTSAEKAKYKGWGIPYEIEPVQGFVYANGYEPLSKLQKWLEEVNPHYISCFPSIFKLLDTSKISNFIDWKGTGENGGTIYSSEECGVIALQCPDNKDVYHVMDNQIIEVDDDGAMIITTMTNPYVIRYKNGDYIEMGTCDCGRKSQVIKKINGRVRNMFAMANGDKRWPLLGSLSFYDDYGIKQFQAIQHTIEDLELKIISEPLNEKEKDLKELINKWLQASLNITITYVDAFPNKKYEEFISLV
jgi:phenylacetate-CoA ligase